jgi:hypothetical protein
MPCLTRKMHLLLLLPLLVLVVVAVAWMIRLCLTAAPPPYSTRVQFHTSWQVCRGKQPCTRECSQQANMASMYVFYVYMAIRTAHFAEAKR